MSFFLVSLAAAISVGLLRSLARPDRGRRAVPVRARPCTEPRRSPRREHVAVHEAA